MKTFHAYVLLLASLMGTGRILASAQVPAHTTTTDNRAEEEILQEVARHANVVPQP